MAEIDKDGMIISPEQIIQKYKKEE